MGLLKTFIRKVVGLQRRHTNTAFAVIMVFSVVMSLGLSNLELETDFEKNLPQQLPILELNRRISDTFAGQDSMIVVLTLDKRTESVTALRDIRDPSVIGYMAELEETLSGESDIVGVVSPATYLQGVPLTDAETVIQAIEASPASGFISRDYETAVMFVSADVGEGDEKIIELDSLIRDRVGSAPIPPGVLVMVTGEPQIIVTLFELLGQDAVNTILYASLIILLLLFVLQRSFSKGLLVFVPLIFGLVWTYGTLGWLDIKISIATAGLGAIILGLGVEYGVFMVTRYTEERKKGKDVYASLRLAVPAIGAAIMGSGTTTMIGFGALVFSVMPLLQNLGISLALGIFYSLFATIFVLPVVIMIEDRVMIAYHEYRCRRAERRLNRCEEVDER